MNLIKPNPPLQVCAPISSSVSLSLLAGLLYFFLVPRGPCTLQKLLNGAILLQGFAFSMEASLHVHSLCSGTLIEVAS